MALKFDITGDNSNVLSSLDGVRAGVRRTAKEVEQQGMGIEDMFKRIGEAAGVAFSLDMAKRFVDTIMSVRGQFQQLEIAFSTMLQSEEKANALMKQLVDTAAKTPFDLKGVAEGAKQLLAYGTAAEDINETITRLGDIAAGLSIPLGDLVYLYGTTMVQGRMFTMDLRQFMGRGIPMAEELAKQFGVAKDEVAGLVTAGKVSADAVKKAIWSMTEEGSKFGGLMAKQSASITGQISNIEDAIDEMFNDMGKKSEEAINAGLSGVSLLVENWETVGKAILAAAETYGIYKATLMGMTAYNSAATNIAYDAEIASLSKLLPLKEEEMNVDLRIAVAEGRLSQSKAEMIASMRAELSEQLRVLAAKEAAATANYKIALEEHLLAQRNMAVAQSQVKIALETGTAEEIAAAKRGAATAKLELQNAAIAKNTAHKELNAIATQREALANGLDAASSAGATASTGLLTQAKLALKRAMDAVNKSFLASPLFWIAATITAVTFAVYKLTTSLSEAEEANKSFDQAQSDVNKSIATERAEIDRLFNNLRNAMEGTKKYEEAKEAIISQYGKYLNGLDEETRTLKDVEKAYKAVTKAAREAAMARGMEAALKNAQESYGEKYSENYDKLYEELKKNVGVKKAKAYMTQVRKELQELGQISKQTQKALMNATNNLSATEYDAQMNDGFTSGTAKFIKNLNDNEKTLKEYTDNITERFKSEEKAIETQKKRNKAAIEQQIKSLRGELEAMTPEEALGKAGKAKKEEIRKLEAELNKAYSTSDKEARSAAKERIKAANELANANANIIEEELRYQDELRKIRQDASDARRDAEIAAIKNDSERQRAEQDEQHQRNLRQIEEQANDMRKSIYERNKKLWETSHKDSPYENTEQGKAGWMGLQLSDDQQATITALMKKENAEYARSVAERHKAEIQSMRDYLKEYGTIQEQKAALAAEYDQKIAETSDEWQKKSLQSQKASELAKLDMKQIAGEIDWSQTFDYVGDLLKDAAKETLEKVNEYMNSSEFKKLSAVDKQSYANLRNQLQDRVGTAANPFSDKVWDELKRNAIAYKNSISYAAKAEEAHTEAVEELKKAQENLEKANTEEEKQLAEIQLNRAKARETETATELNSANTAVTNSQQKLKKSTEEVTKGLNNISEAAQNITSGSLKGFADGLTKLISGGKKDSISQLGKAGGIVGLILTLIDMLGQDASGRLGEIIDSILNAVDSILDQLLSGELIGAILSHLVTGIGKLVGTLLNRLSFGLFSFGGHDNHQKMLDIQEDISNRLGYINDKVSNILDEIKKSSGVDALKKQEEALQAWQNAQESYLRGVMAAGADNYGGGHQDFWHWNKNTRDMAIEIAKYFGISGVNDWQGLFQKITAEQLEEIRKTDINGWWYTMTTQGYNDGAMKDWLDKWADSAETYRQIFTDTNEALTQTTFDNIVNDFSSALLDMDSDAETMSKNFEKYLQDAVIKSLSISKYKPLLDEWYNTFANAMGDGSLSSEERDALMNRWNEITNMGLAERDALKEAFGWGTEEEEEVKDEYFSTLRDSWLSTLTDMEADAEDFNKEIARIMTEDLINSFVLDSAFEEWLEDWKERYTKALEAGDTDALNALRDEQMKRREELAKEAQEYANATGYADMMKAIEEEEEEAEDAFESLHDSFLDALMDMDTDAEEWGKNIAKTIARQIIEEKMLGEAFDSVLDEWKADVNEIIANGSLTDPATIEAIRGKMDSIKGTLGEMAPVVHDFLSAVGLIEEEVKEVDSAFDNLRSTVVSSFMDLEATSEDFYKDISRTMTEEMVNQLIQSRFQNQLDDINNRWKDALTNGDTEAIKTLREELVALRVSAAESVQPLLDDLAEIEKVVEETEIETPFDNLRESFTNTLMNMEETAEDFSDDLAKIISRALIDQFVLGDAFDKKLDEWKERYAEIMDNDSLTDEQRTKYLNDLKDSISEAREDYTQRARDIQEMMGLTSTSSKEDQQASLNMADKATYDQFELYLGIATAQQIAIEQGNEVRKQILSTLQTMSGITSPNGDTVKEIRSMLRTTNEHLYAIKSATEGIRMEFMPRLQSIDNKLSKL